MILKLAPDDPAAKHIERIAAESGRTAEDVVRHAVERLVIDSAAQARAATKDWRHLLLVVADDAQARTWIERNTDTLAEWAIHTVPADRVQALEWDTDNTVDIELVVVLEQPATPADDASLGRLARFYEAPLSRVAMVDGPFDPDMALKARPYVKED